MGETRTGASHVSPPSGERQNTTQLVHGSSSSSIGAIAARPMPLPSSLTSEEPPPPTRWPFTSCLSDISDHVIPPSSDVVNREPAAWSMRPSSNSTKVEEWKNGVLCVARTRSGRVIGTLLMVSPLSFGESLGPPLCISPPVEGGIHPHPSPLPRRELCGSPKLRLYLYSSQPMAGERLCWWRCGTPSLYLSPGGGKMMCGRVRSSLLRMLEGLRSLWRRGLRGRPHSGPWER